MTKSVLFVYGSLKRGFRHHGELRGAEFLKVARTAEGYALCLLGDYPALTTSGRGTVEGELYAVGPEHLRRLDEFEQCPEVYERTRIQLENGETAEAYTITEPAARACPVLTEGRWEE